VLVLHSIKANERMLNRAGLVLIQGDGRWHRREETWAPNSNFALSYNYGLSGTEGVQRSPSARTDAEERMPITPFPGPVPEQLRLLSLCPASALMPMPFSGQLVSHSRVSLSATAGAYRSGDASRPRKEKLLLRSPERVPRGRCASPP